MQDHYETLGVRPDASKDEIEAAWRRAVNFWHPDRNKSREAVERLKEANLAREVLLDEARRREFDRSRVFYAGAGPQQPHGNTRMRPPAASEPSGYRRSAGKGHGAGTYRSMHVEDAAGSRRGKDKPSPKPWSREWLRELLSSARRKSLPERHDTKVLTIFDRNPRIAWLVVAPLGLAAIAIAALFTVLVT